MEIVNHKTKLASRGYTWGRLAMSESAYNKKTKAEKLKLRRKAYNLHKKSEAKRKKPKQKGFFDGLFELFK